MLMFEAFNIACKYDFLCISESYLDSTIPLDDNSLSLNDYNLICMYLCTCMYVPVCITRKTYPLGLSALLTTISIYYVK